MYDFFWAPFQEYLFLRRALIACFALSLGCAPMGVLLVLRRMSLMGDALSHSIMPGVAFGYLVAGLSTPIMGLGGILAGFIVAFSATMVTRYTQLQEDASFVGFYLIALALGTVIISLRGNAVDLSHILFGTILGVTQSSLYLICVITTLSVVILSFIYRALILECFDPLFMKNIGKHGPWIHITFMGLVVLNMVSAFQALGILMALGMMMLPAVAARFWARDVARLFVIAFFVALFSSYGGLLISYYHRLPSGPCIILGAGFCYILSLIFGTHGSLRQKRFR